MFIFILSPFFQDDMGEPEPENNWTN